MLEARPSKQYYSIWTDGSGHHRGHATGCGIVALWQPDLRTHEGTWGVKISFAPGQLMAPDGPTNNTAELMAIRVGLALFKATSPLVRASKKMIHPFDQFDKEEERTDTAILHTDSEWCINSILGKYKNKKNVELIKSCRRAKQRWRSVRLKHVKGHDGNHNNEICDELAHEARAAAGKRKTYMGFLRFDVHTIHEGEEKVASLSERKLWLNKTYFRILAPNLGPRKSFFQSLARITRKTGDFSACSSRSKR